MRGAKKRKQRKQAKKNPTTTTTKAPTTENTENQDSLERKSDEGSGLKKIKCHLQKSFSLFFMKPDKRAR